MPSLELDPESGLPASAPAYLKHFTGAVFDENTEGESDEFAPFEADEGSDAVFEAIEAWSEADEPLTYRDLVAAALELERETVFDDLDADEEYVDPILIALGFLVLRITGAIDAEAREQLRAALSRQERQHGEVTPTFRVMLERLDSFPA